ncbi:hypothetical protein E3P99_03251 [Wallemia hederae]|uniref:Uncharacterized protein n=1 Tax=Wallemia hederae TaxID=1540922 RepID=A0A4T0FG65_9BASI|nr:hypothetical protein E3P99_03251 [Wallemia hederae]
MFFKLSLIAYFAAYALAAPVAKTNSVNKRILDDGTGVYYSTRSPLPTNSPSPDDGKGILFLNTRGDNSDEPQYDAQLLHNDKVSVLKRGGHHDDGLIHLHIGKRGGHDDDDGGLLHAHVLRLLGSDHGHDGEGNILGVGVLKRSHDLTDSSGTIDLDLLQRRGGVLGIGGDGYRDSTLGLFGRGLDILGGDDDHHGDDDGPLIGLLKRGVLLGLGDTGDHHGGDLLDVLKRGGLLSNHADHDNTIGLGIGKRGGLLDDGSPDLAHVGLRRDGDDDEQEFSAYVKRGLLNDGGHHDDDKLHIGVRQSEDPEYSAESVGLRVIDKRSDDEIAGLDLEIKRSDDEIAGLDLELTRRVLGLLDGHEKDNGNLKVDNPVGLRRDKGEAVKADEGEKEKEDTYDAQVALGGCVLNGCDTGGGVVGV